MPSTSLTVVNASLTGAVVTKVINIGNGHTLTVLPPSGGSLDFDTLLIRVRNTASAATVSHSLRVGTQYSSKALGAKTLATLASGQTRIYGGHDLEGARYLTSAGTVVFQQTGTGPTEWEAYQGPRAQD